MTLHDWPEEYTLQARWVIPGDGRVLSPGVIEIAQGEIVAVHSEAAGAEGGATRRDPRIAYRTGSPVIDLGPVAIVPALINAHTHLEFSDLTSPITPARPFAAWIRGVIAARRGRTQPVDDVVTTGWDECRQQGTGAIGEICTNDAAARTLAQIAAEGVVFREVLGLADDSVAQQLEISRGFLNESHQAIDGELALAPHHHRLVRGLSPHAPYSVHPELFHGVIDIACEQSAPVAMHIAETEEELALLSRGTGPLVDLFTEMGLWRPGLFKTGRQPRVFLEQLARCSRALVVHGNYLTNDELQYIAATPALTLVYCPRTHAGFGHREHPWQRLLAAGGRVVIGTDSRASNPDLNLFAELQWLQQQHPEVSSLELLRLATSEAAIALGLPIGMGQILPQTSAKLAVIHWPEDAAPVSTSDLIAGGLCRRSTIRRLN